MRPKPLHYSMQNKLKAYNAGIKAGKEKHAKNIEN